jgi:acetyltransferase-like isoleucine patch superfamily enzyme
MKPNVSVNIRIRHPHHFAIGPGSVVDDFCCFSTRVEVGRHSYIGAGCSVMGEPERKFRLGDYSSLAPGVKICCTSNDFVHDLVTLIPGDLPELLGCRIVGDVLLENYTGVGANSVIMPNNIIPEGTAIGAASFVPEDYPFEPWSVYAGTPIRLLNRRNRDRVLEQVERLEMYWRQRGAA